MIRARAVMAGTSVGMTWRPAKIRQESGLLMQSTGEPHTTSVLLEKTPLESYVPPAKPSLIGLSRVELTERLSEIGVASGQRRMRVQQLWHWIYVRGARGFDEMTSVSR